MPEEKTPQTVNIEHIHAAEEPPAPMPNPIDLATSDRTWKLIGQYGLPSVLCMMVVSMSLWWTQTGMTDMRTTNRENSAALTETAKAMTSMAASVAKLADTMERLNGAINRLPRDPNKVPSLFSNPDS